MPVNLMQPTTPLTPALEGTPEGAIRVQVHRQEDALKIFTTEGNEIQDRLPQICKELLSFANDSFILEGNLLNYQEGEGPVDEEEVRLQLFDISWLGTESTRHLELQERQELLKEFPNTAHILNPVAQMEAKDQEQEDTMENVGESFQTRSEHIILGQAPELQGAAVLNESQMIMEVTIIKPGPSRVKIGDRQVNYSEEALKASLPLWEGAACFCDHFNKSVRNIAGVYFAPWYDDGVKAKLRFIDDTIYHMVSRIMADREQDLTIPDIGISADINIKGMPADHTIEIQEILSVISADIVFSPAAGGSFDRVLNSVRQELGITAQTDRDRAGTEEGALSQVSVHVYEKRVRDLQSTADKLRAQAQNQEESIQKLQSDLSEAVARYREGILQQNPEIPEDLVTGSSIAEIDASLEKARAVVESVKQHLEEKVPAGAPARSGVNVSALSPRQKIEYGVQKRSSSR